VGARNPPRFNGPRFWLSAQVVGADRCTGENLKNDRSGKKRIAASQPSLHFSQAAG
jgi:hypothetical protein